MGTSQKQPSGNKKKTGGSAKPAGKTSARTTIKVPSKTASKSANTKKSAVNTKLSKQEKMSLKPEKSLLRYEIELISIFALTILSAVAIHTELTGYFGSLMKAVYLGLFGFAGAFLAYAIFFVVFFQINRYFSDKKWRLIGAAVFAFLSIWIFSTTFNYSTLYESLDQKGLILMSTEGLKASFDQGVVLRGGGILGNMMVFALINLIGKFGAYLLGTLFAAFAIVLAFKVSLTNLVKRSSIHTYEGLKPLAGKVSEFSKQKHLEKEQAKQEQLADEAARVNLQPEMPQSSPDTGLIDHFEDQRVTLADLPRKSIGIESFNSDLYFETIAQHVDLETGEYLTSEEMPEPLIIDEAPIIEDELFVHFSAFDDETVEEDSDAVIDAAFDMGIDLESEEIIDESVEENVDQNADELFDDLLDNPIIATIAPTAAPTATPTTGPATWTKSVPTAQTTAAPVIKPKPKPKPYIMPPLTLLNPAKAKTNNNRDEIVENVKILEVTLKNFGVDAKVTEVTKGPAITMYEVMPAPGVKVSKIVNLTDDIALALAASQIRIIAPIPGKSAIGIEIPNKDTTMVTAREVFESEEFKKTDSKLSFALGKEITGKTLIGDLAKMPHLLIAGSTGSGKSVCVNTIINSILFNAKPDEVKLLMIDPKVVELSHYNGIPHLILPVVVDPKKASIALNWAVNEMTNRYKSFAEQAVKDINSFNKKVETQPALQLEKMAKIVIIVDELADLMMAAPNQVEDAICRLAQMARAAGIHLIVATQRPSVDVITGLIKANIPSRIAFAVSSQIDSRTILDMAGAEKLLGKGDMLFYPLGANKPIRIQGAFLADAEVEGVVNFIKQQTEEVTYQDEILADVPEPAMTMEVDEILKDAVEMVVESGQASISMVQRKFRVGYNRAARLIDQMEERGIVGPSLGSKPREVLLTRLELEKLKL